MNEQKTMLNQFIDFAVGEKLAALRLDNAIDTLACSVKQGVA